MTTIEPLTLLPEFTDPVEVDGSQGLGEKVVRVEIDGNQVTGGTSSRGLLLHLGAEGSSIHNIAVNSFPGDGITVYGDEATVEYVIAGMDAGGTEDKGNGRNGITLQGARGTVAQSAASGNAQHGIEVWPLAGVSDGAENTIRGSRIGTNREGSAAVANESDGIHLTLNTIEADGDDLTIGGSEGLTAGGKCSGDCNLISGNEGEGIEVRVSGAGAERTTASRAAPARAISATVRPARRTSWTARRPAARSAGASRSARPAGLKTQPAGPIIGCGDASGARAGPRRGCRSQCPESSISHGNTTLPSESRVEIPSPGPRRARASIRRSCRQSYPLFKPFHTP